MNRGMHRICVVGCPRSGTTVVQSLIGSHPDILPFPETMFAALTYGDHSERFFLKDFSHKKLLREFTRSIRRTFTISTLESKKSLIEFRKSKKLPDNKELIRLSSATSQLKKWMGSFDELAARSGKAGWSEKTPYHLAYVDEIRMACPEMRFVFVERPAVRVIDSLISAHTRYPDSEAWRDFGDLEYCIQVYLRSRDLQKKNFNPEKDISVKFNELTDSPVTQTQKIFESLGLKEVDINHVISERAKASKEIIESNEPWKSGVIKSITSKNEGVKHLSCEDIEKITIALETHSV